MSEFKPHDIKRQPSLKNVRARRDDGDLQKKRDRSLSPRQTPRSAAIRIPRATPDPLTRDPRTPEMGHADNQVYRPIHKSTIPTPLSRPMVRRPVEEDLLGSCVEHSFNIEYSPSSPSNFSPSASHRFSIASTVSSLSPTAILEAPDPPSQPYIRSRRTAVSSEPVSIQSMADWKPPVHAKTATEEQRIAQVISTKLNVLFGHLSKENEHRVVRAMFKKHVPSGTELIRQGDDGDNYYIVDAGRFDIFVTRPGAVTTKVLEASVGMSFGELALMYNSQRAATCIATEDSVVWALDRTSFRMLLVTAENLKKKRYESLLERIEIFKCLTKFELSQLSDILAIQECKEGECIIRQGDRGDRFYVVESGELVCRISQEGAPELEVHRYRRGGFFGELALIMKYGIRKASVYSVGPDTRLLWICKSTFDRVLGPIVDVLRKNADRYPTYAQLLVRR